MRTPAPRSNSRRTSTASPNAGVGRGRIRRPRMLADLDATLADLREDEGTILHAYRDHLGFWTIGTGRLIDQRRGGGISLEENDYLLTNDVVGRASILHVTYPWFSALDPVRQSAFVNLAFNLGFDGLAKFKN